MPQIQKNGCNGYVALHLKITLRKVFIIKRNQESKIISSHVIYVPNFQLVTMHEKNIYYIKVIHRLAISYNKTISVWIHVAFVL